MNGNASTRQEQLAHLDEKVTSLVEQVSEGYGGTLVEQLIHRMELTVREFEAEVDQLLERLRHSTDTQEELLGRIRRKDVITGPSGLISRMISEEEVPEWERRLADLEGSAK